MAWEIAIDSLCGEIRIALLRSGSLQEIIIARAGEPSIAGNIYLGRVQRVAPGIGAAFVDLGAGTGADKAGFLSERDARILATKKAVRTENGKPAIDRLVHEGESLVVQAMSEPVGGKGPRVTADVSLPGRLLIYRPLSPGVAISRRIGGETERRKLRETIAAIGEPADGGFVVRTAAANADGLALTDEAHRLIDGWRAIENATRHAGKPRCLRHEPGPIGRKLRDWAGDQDAMIRVDGAAALREARRYAEQHDPALAERLSRHRGGRPLFEEYGIEAAVETAFGPRVELPRGGWIMIESTEALTAIDVNAGSRIEGSGREESARRVNFAAVREIARQLRLRNIGGLIVLDLISMTSKASWDRVLDELKKHLAMDRAATHVAGVTRLGLVELTRRRSGPTLEQMLNEPCPACRGAGRRQSLETVGLDVLRRARYEADQGRPGNLWITAHPDVARWLERKIHGQEAGGDLHAEFGRNVIIEAESTMERVDFRISTRPPGQTGNQGMKETNK
ncbi:MAG: Rne/Rng family ribonuclease [Sphingomonadales bacterium]